MISGKIVAIVITVVFIIAIIVLSVLYTLAKQDIDKNPKPELDEQLKVQRYFMAIITIVVFTIISLILAIVPHN